MHGLQFAITYSPCEYKVSFLLYFVQREGKRPWSHLTHLLSGRIRTQRHTQKFKFPVSDESADDNGSQSSLSTNSDFSDVTPLTQMHG